MSFWQRARDLLVDPNLIALMLSIRASRHRGGALEPGPDPPGDGRGHLGILGLYGLQVLPVSIAGLLLMLLAAAFFVAEAFGHRPPARSPWRADAFVLGALMLFDPRAMRTRSPCPSRSRSRGPSRCSSASP